MIEGRSVEMILADWRHAERVLDAMVDGPDKAIQETLLEQLREEHRQALVARDRELQELRGL